MTAPRKDGLDAWEVLSGGSKSSSVQIVSRQTFFGFDCVLVDPG